MANSLSRATIGDDKPQEILLSAGITSLKSRAGILPKKTKEKAKKSTLKVVRESEDLQSELDMLRKASNLDFDNYEESAAYFAVHNLNPLMPVMPLTKLSRSLYEIWRWTKERAWIAGSAALWCVDAEASWLYGDVDIFCRSVEFYKDLCDELKELECRFDESVHVTKFFDSPFKQDDMLFSETLSVICPAEKDWSSIEGLLTGFDWTICAVAIKDPATAYAYSPYDVRRSRTSAIRLDFPRRSLKRLLKYVNRGYWAGHEALEALAQDGRVHEDFELLNEAIKLDGNSKLGELVRRYNTAVAELESEDYEEYSDDYDYESEYYEDGYTYS